MTDLARIQSAAARLAGHARLTPLLESPLLNARAGRRVLVKAEGLQWTGSFKFRGAWSALTALPSGTKGVLAYSSGNHAQGVALAAARLGMAAVIVMPADAPAVKIANTRAYGAEVVLYDRATEDRDALGASLAAARGLALVKPFDDAEVMAGQGTAGLEIARQAAEAGVSRAAVLVPCGGGGLASGVALALEDHPALRVRTVEPEGFDDMARSLRSGLHERNATATGSLCDAILTPSPGVLTLPVLKRLAGPGLTVTDDQALFAVAQAFHHLRLVGEPGGAVALAAALTDPGLPETVIAILSGANVDPALFAQALSLHPA